MELIDKLKQQRAEYIEQYERTLEDQSKLRTWLRDLDIAIAALEPQPPTTPPPPMSDDERAELIQRTEGDEAEQANALTSEEPTSWTATHNRIVEQIAPYMVHHPIEGPSPATMAMFDDDGESADIATLTVAEPYQIEASAGASDPHATSPGEVEESRDHFSDCATHNEPAMANRECDCAEVSEKADAA